MQDNNFSEMLEPIGLLFKAYILIFHYSPRHQAIFHLLINKMFMKCEYTFLGGGFLVSYFYDQR